MKYLLHSKTYYSDFNLSSLCSSFLMLLSSEAENINCVAFGLVRAWLQSMLLTITPPKQLILNIGPYLLKKKIK